MAVLKSPSDGGGVNGGGVGGGVELDTKSMISESHAPPSQSRGAPIQGAWINTMPHSGAASVSGMSRRSAHSARGGGKAVRM